MTALAHSQLLRSLLARLREPAALRRGVMAGAAWGIALAAGLTALSAWQCGGICLDETAWLGITSVGTGILAIGPVAALGRTQAQARTPPSSDRSIASQV
ncbi:MAG TPA: hypothetical protein VNR11_07065 [Xanthobacteraceae bacterium]|nr:hypothetical protein [Xanthobacteraceae bacterium]